MTTLSRWATGRNILILLLLFLFMNLVIIPAYYPKFQTLDMLGSYTPEQVSTYIASYGEQGRATYLVVELTLDLVYPFTTALFFSLLILYSFRGGFPAAMWTQQLAWIPFAVMLADYLENACIVIMLLNYPRAMEQVAALSNTFTMTKFALTPFELVFVIGLIAWLVTAIRQRSKLKDSRL
jgi:hypothetical protein